MNHEEAISSHLQWKSDLAKALRQPDLEGLDPATAGRDDLCELGAWLHAVEHPMADRPECIDLKLCHAEFHRLVGEIVQVSMGGDRAAAEQLLSGPFQASSIQVIAAIMRCKGRDV